MRRACLLLMLVAQALRPGAARAQPAPAPERPSFADFVAGLRAEALSRGIRKEIVDEALNIPEPLPVVLENDRAQPEIVLSLEKYVSRRLTARLVKAARAHYEEQRALVDAIGERYAVPSAILVAIWGLESDFGHVSGDWPTVAALATLAWDSRRPALFRRELFDALEILNRGDIELPRMRGSWAGAMGQVQFMPSSYLRFAVDHDGDGRRDIWSSAPDWFASVANYLKAHGWTAGQGWGREVKLSHEAERRIASAVERRKGACAAMRDMSVALPLARWRELGARLPSGQLLPKSDSPAALVSGAKRRFLVSANYDALLEYNCAHAYAISVGLLADRIAEHRQ